MSKLFDDTDRSNITLKEWAAVKCILESERGGILARELLTSMSEMDETAPSYFLGIIPKISQIQTAKLNAKVHNMRGSMGALGRRLSADKFTSGSNKGTPKFYTQKFAEGLDLCAWEMLEFIQEFVNFQEYAHEVELGTRSDIPTASRVCQCDDLALAYVLRFCKFLDDLETKSLGKLVSPQVFDCNPNLENMIEWHRKHRSEWDDVSDKYKPHPISRHESLAEDLCDNGDG